MTYPTVAGESETIAKVSQGFNLARFGDGELKMAEGAGYSRQTGSPKLAAELTRIIRRPRRGVIVGIPTMNPDGPKYQNWLRHKERFERLVTPGTQYYSAFVTRPDSAPWISTLEYVLHVQSLWEGKRVAVMCERKGSMFRAVRPAASKAWHVECPHFGAYDEIDRLEKEILGLAPDIAILSAGPAATCLADRLAKENVHAVDLGSMGQFIVRTLASSA